MTVLVTGGAGYIGSHTCIELIEAGFDVVVVDNLRNSKSESLKRVGKIVGKTIPFHKVDICDKAALSDVFASYKVSSVIHFAGLKAVGESCEMPLEYYRNNVGGTVTLCEVMDEHNVHNYGRSKLIVEEILRDGCKIPNSNWRISLLRYFNPIGAHISGTIGEDPQGIPNNLLPYVAQVAVGKLPKLGVFGSDYDTVDGTGVRDYIHVVDLAKGHVKALQKLEKSEPAAYTYNLGTGQGYSVLQVVEAFEKASGKKVPYELKPRRPGDIAECYADPALAASELGWKAEFGIERMVEDTWRWQSSNPQGYEG